MARRPNWWYTENWCPLSVRYKSLHISFLEWYFITNRSSSCSSTLREKWLVSLLCIPNNPSPFIPYLAITISFGFDHSSSTSLRSYYFKSLVLVYYISSAQSSCPISVRVSFFAHKLWIYLTFSSFILSIWAYMKQ